MKIEDMMKIIPTPQSNKGGKYCEAIDEDLYDSSQWENNMPSDGYSFYEQDNGTVKVSYIGHFACLDGWDSMDDDCGTFDNMHDAVKSIYDEIILNERITGIQHKMNDLYEKSKTNFFTAHKEKINIIMTSHLLALFSLEQRMLKTRAKWA